MVEFKVKRSEKKIESCNGKEKNRKNPLKNEFNKILFEMYKDLNAASNI